MDAVGHVNRAFNINMNIAMNVNPPTYHSAIWIEEPEEVHKKNMHYKYIEDKPDPAQRTEQPLIQEEQEDMKHVQVQDQGHHLCLAGHLPQIPKLQIEDSTKAEVLVANFFCRFGIPRELHSDQGRNFESHLLKEVLQHLGVSKTRTTPLHPQSDGMVERYVKTIEEHLRKVVTSHQRDWDERLPLFLLAYRASSHDTTGLTPVGLVFGRELRLPCNPQPIMQQT
ncbi:hypothetical protein B7P43_G15981 [Cryptotermes secundus]|uniref:Integrase catalytic domain-containing protein n=1 Tax=Cryptotermes secundus TaxID=105785 RepID=A0A2J7PRH0_9NEOP|nr:hypothetical protein B7P43_G15981 [Cryptotermes secundus]